MMIVFTIAEIIDISEKLFIVLKRIHVMAIARDLFPERWKRMTMGSERMSEGWGSVWNGKKWHYFVREEGHRFAFSLCGKYGFYEGELEQGNDDSPDNCKECMKRLMKRLKGMKENENSYSRFSRR